MPTILCTSLFAVLIFATSVAFADTFEFLTFTPPPGWTKQVSNNQMVYRRPNGIGMISFIPSYQTVGLPADEFAKIWAGHIGTTLRGPTPPPQVERIGSYTVAIGGTKVNAQGTMTTISLVAFVGQGRAVGVLGMAAGDDAERELIAFFDTLKDGLRKDRLGFFSGLLRDVFYDVQTSAKSTVPVSQAVVDWSLQMAMQASIRALIESVDAFGKEDFTADLAAVEVPTLILHGNADKPVPLELTAKRAAAAIKQAKLIVYPGATHGLLVTERERVTHDLLEFLRA